MEDRKKDFEKWTESFYGGLTSAADTWSDKQGAYMDYAHHMSWSVWQKMAARIAELEAELAKAREVPEMPEPVAYMDHHKAGDNLEWEQPHGKFSPLYTDRQIRAMFERNKG